MICSYGLSPFIPIAAPEQGPWRASRRSTDSWFTPLVEEERISRSLSIGKEEPEGQGEDASQQLANVEMCIC